MGYAAEGPFAHPTVTICAGHDQVGTLLANDCFERRRIVARRGSAVPGRLDPMTTEPRCYVIGARLSRNNVIDVSNLDDRYS